MRHTQRACLLLAISPRHARTRIQRQTSTISRAASGGVSPRVKAERLAWRISAAAGIIPVPLRPIRADFNYDTREVLRLLLDTTQNDGALRFSLFTTASLYLYRCISISRTKYRVEVKRFGRFLWLSPNRGRRDEARARFDARRRTHSL